MPTLREKIGQRMGVEKGTRTFSPVSDLMGRENHIFTVGPKAEVERDLDWRLPLFEAGRYLIAFDGAGLLVLELWRRRRSR